jgi:hypothetical protein
MMRNLPFVLYVAEHHCYFFMKQSDRVVDPVVDMFRLQKEYKTKLSESLLGDKMT